MRNINNLVHLPRLEKIIRQPPSTSSSYVGTCHCCTSRNRHGLCFIKLDQSRKRHTDKLETSLSRNLYTNYIGSVFLFLEFFFFFSSTFACLTDKYSTNNGSCSRITTSPTQLTRSAKRSLVILRGNFRNFLIKVKWVASKNMINCNRLPEWE